MSPIKSFSKEGSLGALLPESVRRAGVAFFSVFLFKCDIVSSLKVPDEYACVNEVRVRKSVADIASYGHL